MADFATVGIYPTEVMGQYKRLLEALAQAFPITFIEAKAENLVTLDAIILLSTDSTIGEFLKKARIRYHLIIHHSEKRTSSATVKFGNETPLNRFLQSCTLQDKEAVGVPIIIPEPGDKIFASSDDKPIWVYRELTDKIINLVSVMPKELNKNETLRDHLSAGRFISLLPLVHFVREITKDLRWSPPPLRACFILDDPNLHALSYGYLNYPKVIRHAKHHNYHLAVATIPLDSWLINPHVAELFRNHPKQLSLLIHGNNHTANELSRPLTDTQCTILLAQALKRITRLEQRAQVSVSQIMAPPHEVCNETMMRAMHYLGFEAACINRTRWQLFLSQDNPLAGWGVAELVAGGFPVISRNRFKVRDRDDISLLAFLEQPIILYGHHHEVGPDLSKLAEIADQINSLGEVSWLSMENIARSNYMTRQVGTTLFIRLYSRRVSIEISEGIKEIVVELAIRHPLHQTVEVVINAIRMPLLAGVQFPRTEPLPVEGLQIIEIKLFDLNLAVHNDFPNPYISPWSVFRRFLTEARDRLQPIFWS